VPLGHDVQNASQWTNWPQQQQQQQQQQQTSAEYFPTLADLDAHIASVNPNFDWEAGPSTTDYSQQQGKSHTLKYFTLVEDIVLTSIAGPSTHAYACHYEGCSHSYEKRGDLR
jgi:hypothetical protein